MSTVFKHLLLATEHTEFDAGAETVALALARQCRLPLAGVLPLVSNPEYEALAPEIAARTEQAASAKIAQVRASAQAHGVELDLRARRGPEPYREIVDEARERGSDLIVIRRRGQRGFLANLLLGEMVSKVVAHAPCSVLIVPRGARMWQSRVLVAAEPTEYGQQLIARAAAVAAECALPLHIVSVIAHDEPALRQQTEAFIDRALQALRHSGLSVQGQTRVGTPYQEILAAIQRDAADLLVIGSRGDRRIQRSLIGGVAQKVIGLAECPVLVVPSKT
jgi:hypothetical protein